jgi:hypothetical protein
LASRGHKKWVLKRLQKSGFQFCLAWFILGQHHELKKLINTRNCGLEGPFWEPCCTQLAPTMSSQASPAQPSCAQLSPERKGGGAAQHTTPHHNTPHHTTPPHPPHHTTPTDRSLHSALAASTRFSAPSNWACILFCGPAHVVRTMKSQEPSRARVLAALHEVRSLRRSVHSERRYSSCFRVANLFLYYMPCVAMFWVSLCFAICKIG